MVVERDHLAIDDGVGKGLAGPGNGREPRGPVEAFARAHDGFTAFDPELHAVAVELDLVHPILSRRWAADPLAELGRDEAGHPASALSCTARRHCLCRGNRWRGRACTLIPV